MTDLSLVLTITCHICQENLYKFNLSAVFILKDDVAL